jgi:iron complex outermembrane receptor protein
VKLHHRNHALVFFSLLLCSNIAIVQAQPSESSSPPVSPETPDQSTTPATPPSTPAAPVTSTAPGKATVDLDEIVVNGIKRGDLILPTTVTSGSAYGLDLGVMDTPRNNTVLSKTQLDTLNVQNPGGFSALTSSAYSDAAFGQPNVPRIRGQYADMFYNGMRDSFTLNGYGAPVSFIMVDSIDIVKGPASVQGGPGAGVGGAIDITTKMPSFDAFIGSAQAEFDSQEKRIVGFDIGGPLSPDFAGRLAVTSNDSGSYYTDMYFHQQQLYAAGIWRVNPDYTISVNGSFVDTRYRENDGINRVNQNLIDNGTYLTGTPITDIGGIGTVLDLNGTTKLGRRTIIDEPDGNGAHAQKIMLQAIQNLHVNDNLDITNNTFYSYLNRYNQAMDYYADSAIGSFSIENKTDFKLNFTSSFAKNDIDAGFTFRYLHVKDIQNYSNEPVSVFDLSLDPSTWVFPASAQASSAGAVLYNAAFGHQQWGVASDNSILPGQSVLDNLRDVAVFLEHRMEFSPQWSLLYGVREDAVQINESDPLYKAVLATAGTPNDVTWSLDPNAQISQRSAWYGLYNGNVSLVYSPDEWVSGYLTYNKAQYTLPNDNDGSINTLGTKPTALLRQNTLLEEAGLKFDLLDKSLFISSAVFHQERAVSDGPGGLDHSLANIKGAEIELNYQPDPHFFATASYSYLHTTLQTPSTFWNFPAQPGINIDGAGGSLVFAPNQTFKDPGVPSQLFNALVNYKLDSGWSFQGNVQVTSPIETTQSGRVDVAATEQALANNLGFLGIPTATLMAAIPASVIKTGYYKSPVIPWQWTLNTAVSYHFAERYTVKFAIYNVANKRNLQNDYPYYGNDFVTVLPPRSYDLTFTVKL